MCQDENRSEETPNKRTQDIADSFLHSWSRASKWPEVFRKKEVTPESLLDKTVRYKDAKKRASNSLLTVVAVYSPKYKNYENSEHNIRVKNEKGTMWTCHHSEVVEVVVVKTYAYVNRKGQVSQFTSEEAGEAERERRAKDAEKWERRPQISVMPVHHPSQNYVLERAPQFDQTYGEKEVE